VINVADLAWLRVVESAHNANANTWVEDSVTVKRVRGGANNALYRVDVDGQCYACKLCVADERQRARREYGALRLLQRAGLDIAPQPVGLDESCTRLSFPAVAYRWLEGEPLGSSPTAEQLSALRESVQQMHSLQPRDFEDVNLPDAWMHWFAFEPYLEELCQLLVDYGEWLAKNDLDGQALYNRLVRLVESCSETILKSGVHPSREQVALRLCHVDSNLANAMWGSDRRVRWVDWEYSGWGDPAFELADLRWHIALEGLSEAQHNWIRANYRRPDEDDGFEERLAIWDRLLVTRWPFLIARLFWSIYNGPDRVRLTRPVDDPVNVRQRLIRVIERAERFVWSGV
jgi:thiamine kinase-like enzyme